MQIFFLSPCRCIDTMGNPNMRVTGRRGRHISGVSQHSNFYSLHCRSERELEATYKWPTEILLTYSLPPSRPVIIDQSNIFILCSSMDLCVLSTIFEFQTLTFSPASYTTLFGKFLQIRLLSLFPVLVSLAVSLPLSHSFCFSSVPAKVLTLKTNGQDCDLWTFEC